MHSRFAAALSCVLVCLFTTVDAQWSQFRGPNGSGIGDGAGYPTEFSPTTNVAWKSAVPFGQSSPVIAGGRLYLTGIEGDELVTLAFDAGTGKALWRRALHRQRKMEMYKANDPASPTPAADERGVVAFFADFGIVA
jgi:outer membrane protein assembly factor BamB